VLVWTRKGLVVGTRQELARRWPALVAAAVLLVLVAFARPAVGDEHGHQPTVPAPGGDGYAPEESYRGILPPGNWTPEQVVKAKDLVKRTEAALKQFDTHEKAAAAGYSDFGVVAPGGWEHWGKLELNDDDHVLDPNFPETVVFQRMPQGGVRIVAAMFQLANPPYTVDNVPEDIAWYPGWHDHDGEFCVDQVTRKWRGLLPCPPGSTSDNKAPMMHVWTVDIPECNNRFGGIGVGGLHCGDHGHNPMPEYPPYPGGTWRPGGTWGPGGTRPVPPPTSPPSSVDRHEIPPATPVKTNPHFTG
jgi:hypothetical protein